MARALACVIQPIFATAFFQRAFAVADFFFFFFLSSSGPAPLLAGPSARGGH